MEQLNKRVIFNPKGDVELSKRKMIGGNSTGMNDFNNMKYHWVSEWYRQAMNNFWIPEEINMGEDIKNYRELSEAEKTAYDKVLSFLVFLDSVQTSNLPNVADYITANEVNMCLNIQTFQEVIHCFKEGTEIFTSEGWKDFRDITMGTEIANISDKDELYFTKPSGIISSYYKGTLYDIHNKRACFHQVVTPNHRLITYKNEYRNGYSFEDIRADKLVNSEGEYKKIPIVSRPSGYIKNAQYDHIDNDMKLYLLLNLMDYVGEGKIKVTYKIKSYNRETIEFILSIINNAGVRGYNLHKDDGYIYLEMDKIHVHNTSRIIHHISKCQRGLIQSMLYSLYGNGEVEITSEVYELISRLTTLNGGSVEVIQRLSYGNIICKIIPGGISYFELDPSNTEIKKVYYEGKVYCVTVESGRILVRYNDCVSISGNSQSYSYMLDTICSPEERNEIIYQWRDDEHLLRRNEYIGNIYNDFQNDKSIHQFLRTCVANYVLEGIYFYSGFMFFYNLGRNSKMPGSVQQIRYINRDENTHLWLFRNILRELQREHPELFTEESIKEFKSILKEGAEQEIAWGKYVLGNRIEGLTEEMIESYIKYLANLRSLDLGFGVIYEGFENEPESMSWVSQYSNPNMVKTDFFEGKVTSYSKAGAIEDDL